MKLLRKLFSEDAALLKRAKNAEAERDRLCDDLAHLLREQQSRLSEIAALQRTLNETKAKLREQTDADLLLVSARIVSDVLKGKKPTPSDLALQNMLIGQQGLMNTNTYGLASVLDGLGGLGQLFKH